MSLASSLPRVLLAGALTLAAGCVLPPHESPHPAALAQAPLGAAAGAVEPAPAAWWASFADPELDRLIEEGLAANPTLAQAQSRIAEALAQSEVARAALAPTVNASASALYQRAPQNYLIPPPYAGHTFWMGQGGASLGWDLDFWGRQADALRSARAELDAARLDAQSARLMLAGAITEAYIELYRQDALADIASRSEAQRENIVDITRRRVAAGLDTQLELREAEGELPQARVARERADASAQLAAHQLAALIGHGADAYAGITRPALTIDAVLPVPAQLPINLLARRPDVLSARRAIDAADAQRLAARAAFYPSVSLRALAGVGALGLHNLVQASAAGAGAGPFLTLPLFDAGRLRAEYRGAEAQLDQSIERYNETVLSAVQQTADQLTQIDALARERADQQSTLAATEAAYRLAEERYRAGLASYLSVLNAETQVLTARQTMVDIITGEAIARVRLLLAVGGSFDPTSLE